MNAPPTPAELRFGVSLPPASAALDELRRAVAAADEAGLDLVGIQDHPYVEGFMETLSLIGVLLGDTSRVTLFPDVASLPLRPAAMLGKAAVSLSVLSGGRFELGVGSGASADGIRAMGGPVLAPGDAVEALVEGLAVIRGFTEPHGPIRHAGRHHAAAGVRPGPPPAGPLPIWIGSVGPRMLRLTGRLADGWASPVPAYLPYERWADAQALVDAGARDAGRDPRAVRRMAQLPGQVDERLPGGPPRGAEPLGGSPAQWACNLAGLAAAGFDTFVLWPRGDWERQVQRFAREVAPATRELLARAAAA